ncbi:Lrp/AsnC family transcriptional regulator [Shimia gijangensis]|uniref:Lrp/AsnC family transcriptional regulator n=1 Tax=Shimia gijangensis TaxID=1470563 RepID=A0A1M6Q196_9RHOB|nr:Lrp/AsnC family transcriptional regulator [Shimia gijangensis]SHK14015.1 Lrp/AsnC family transcriptional regulator [Shimia gijangensis]
MIEKIDQIDRRILDVAQRDGSLSQRELAEQVGLSQNALWRRLKRLEEDGVMLGSHRRVSASKLGLDLTVFVMVRTRSHSDEWIEAFRSHVRNIPQVIEMHRIGGDWDYMLKVVTRGMSGYDKVYKRLTTGIELETVTGFFSMETMLEDRPLDVFD